MPPIEVPDFLAPPEGGLPEIDLSNALAVPDEDEPVDATALWRARIEEIRLADRDRRPEDVFVLLGRDARLVPVVAVWRSLELRFEAPMDIPPPDDMSDGEVLTRSWSRLWNPGNRDQAKEPMPTMLQVATGLNAAETQIAMRVALQARLIYPNGEIHPAAEHYLRVEAAAVLLTRGQALAAQAKGK